MVRESGLAQGLIHKDERKERGKGGGRERARVMSAKPETGQSRESEKGKDVQGQGERKREEGRDEESVGGRRL